MLDTKSDTAARYANRRADAGEVARRVGERTETARRDEAHRWIEARRIGRQARAPRRLPATVSA